MLKLDRYHKREDEMREKEAGLNLILDENNML